MGAGLDLAPTGAEGQGKARYFLSLVGIGIALRPVGNRLVGAG